MPRIRAALVAAAATLALAVSISSAQMMGPRVTYESTRAMLDFAMRENGINASLTTPFQLTEANLWITTGSIVETAGATDKVRLSWNSLHFVAPHDEDPNLNHYVASFVVDGAVEHTAEPRHVGDFRDCRIVPHEEHWDVWIATMNFEVDPSGNILFWGWMLDGDHFYALDYECFFSGHLDDGGVTPGRGGCVAATTDTLAHMITVNAEIAGVPLATVLQASLRAGPNGPDIVTIPAAALAEQDGALTIAARDVWFDHAGVPVLAAGQAYLAVVTTQGLVGGFLQPIAPQVVGVAPNRPAADIALRVSPNPAVRSIQIRYRVPEPATPVSLLVHDVTGRRVRGVTLAPSNEGTYTLDLRSDDGVRLAAGLYFATLNAGDRRVRQRFVVVD